MRKKQQLVKNIRWLIIILGMVYALSIVFNQFLTFYHNEKNNKQLYYNHIHILLGELETTADKLNGDVSAYQNTDNTMDKAADESDFNQTLNIYEGLNPRNGEIYLIDNGATISFNSLLTSEINLYAPQYSSDIEAILTEVNVIIYNDQNKFSGENPPLLGVPDNGSADLSVLIENLEFHLKTGNELMNQNYDQMISMMETGWYTSNTALLIVGVFLLIRLNSLLIKPIVTGHKFLEEISAGNSEKRWQYNYNNEFGDLVSSFNHYLDVTQNSYRLIKEQYNQLKIYSDNGEINYFEYDFTAKELKVLYSSKFMKKYNIGDQKTVYPIEDYLALIHLEDREGLKEFMNFDEKPEVINYRIRLTKEAGWCYLSVSAQMRGQLLIGVQVDVTRLKNTQNLLKQQEELYRLLVENSKDLIIKYTPDGRVIYSSQSYKDLTKSDVENPAGNLKRIEAVLKPPYKSTGISEFNGRWISWSHEAILVNDKIEYIIAVGHDITEIQNANGRLKYESEHDLLTGLLNRRGLFNGIAQISDVRILAAFFIDINNFKNINDFYGHEVGDLIISKVADELKSFSEYGCIIGRLSGDEFLILLPNYENNSHFNMIKNKLVRSTHKNFKIKNNNIFISSSIGYAVYPHDTDNINKLISFADMAMYEAKISHNMNILRFTENMFHMVNTKMEMACELKRAIDNDEFTIAYQPIMNVKTDRVDSFESLVRWDSRMGEVMPKDFLPIAEDTGLIQTLDIMLIKKSFKIFRHLQGDKQYENVKLAINVTPILLLEAEFPERLSRLVKRESLTNGDIIVEISENTFVNNVEKCSEQLEKLRNLGFLIALDDFGNEYSSLSILEKVEFDIIKIDMIFTSNLDNGINVEIIKMVQKIAKLKNKVLIVEGVETKAQKQRLLELDCELMQGFYFSKPVRMESVNEKILVTK